MLFFLAPAAAQRQRRLDCPRPARQRAYRPAPALSLELAAGFSKPLLYHNGAGPLNNHYHFSSLAIPYLSATGYIALNDRLDVLAGLSVTQTWQGLQASFDYANTSYGAAGYTGSFTVRVPLGLAYHINPKVRLAVAPYVSFSTHSGYTYDAAEAVSASGQPGYNYSFESPEDKARIGFGLSVAAQVKIGRRLGVEGSCAADGSSSTPSFGIAYLNYGSTSATVRGSLEPYLLHIGLGVCYKLWMRE